MKNFFVVGEVYYTSRHARLFQNANAEASAFTFIDPPIDTFIYVVSGPVLFSDNNQRDERFVYECIAMNGGRYEVISDWYNYFNKVKGL